jgi:heme exporter protein CcmD
VIEAGDHMAFVVAAYAVAGLTVALLILWAHFGERRQRRLLDALDARGADRRGEGEA